MLASACRPGDVVRIRGERWRVARQWVQGKTPVVLVTGADTDNRGQLARFLLPFEPVEALPGSALPRVVAPADLDARQWPSPCCPVPAEPVPAR